MVLKVTPLFFLLPFFSVGQEREILTDSRDNQEYRYAEINGLKWMLDNLNYFTELSFDLSPEANHSLRYKVPTGRWYHLSEIDTVCPKGWRLPTGDEWLNYIVQRVEKVNGKYREDTFKDTHRISSSTTILIFMKKTTL